MSDDHVPQPSDLAWRGQQLELFPAFRFVTSHWDEQRVARCAPCGARHTLATFRALTFVAETYPDGVATQERVCQCGARVWAESGLVRLVAARGYAARRHPLDRLEEIMTDARRGSMPDLRLVVELGGGDPLVTAWRHAGNPRDMVRALAAFRGEDAGWWALETVRRRGALDTPVALEEGNDVSRAVTWFFAQAMLRGTAVALRDAFYCDAIRAEHAAPTLAELERSVAAWRAA